MPTLNWIGKEAVIKHHKDVPFRLLEPVPELSCGVEDDRLIGGLWASLSNGRCRFVMVKDKQWDNISNYLN